MIREREYGAMSGWGALVVLLGGAAFFFWQIIARAQVIQQPNQPLLFILSIVGLLFCGFLLLGLFVVNPNEGEVLQLFGKYVGTARVPGLRFANPLYAKKRISLRVRNFESAKLKVNDIDGNPIEIAAVVVWKASTRPRPFSKSTTTRTTCTCRAKRRYATW
jgi:regulator of protease activity HflC (stomatin/prohibitin superfamily)